MNAMVGADTMALQWYAVRLARPKNPNRKTTLIGVEKETYRNRQGKVCRRPVKGTGQRVFVPELILRRAGFDVFLPKKKVWRRKNRYGPEKQLVTFPAMADWIFVGWPECEDRWHELMNLAVVQGVAGYGGKPMRIEKRDRHDTRALNDLRNVFSESQVGAPAEHQYMRTHLEYKVGDRVRVSAGAFEGQEVKVIGMETSRAKVLLQFFGDEFQVCMRADLLERLWK